jgi:uncharacterized protein (DUF1330 family)
MIYLTQLIFLNPEEEAVFEEFESRAILLIARYGGKLLLRLRPDVSSVIEAGMEIPYEIHLVSFPDEDAFTRFKADPERQQFLHLKEQSVSSSMLIGGQRL